MSHQNEEKADTTSDCSTKIVPNQPIEDNYRDQKLQLDEEIVIPQDDHTHCRGKQTLVNN